jgi:hypothetical protein
MAWRIALFAAIELASAVGTLCGFYAVGARVGQRSTRAEAKMRLIILII